MRLDKKPWSLKEEELDKVIKQSLNAEGIFSEQSLSRKRKVT